MISFTSALVFKHLVGGVFLAASCVVWVLEGFDAETF